MCTAHDSKQWTGQMNQYICSGSSLPLLCGLYLPPLCGLSPPFVWLFSTVSVWIFSPYSLCGPFHLNQNLSVNLSPNLCYHTHKFLPILHEVAQGGDHRCSSVGLAGCHCVWLFVDPSCRNSSISTVSEWIGAPYCRVPAFFFVYDSISASFDSPCLALSWPSSS